jgi:hypothetical protein
MFAHGRSYYGGSVPTAGEETDDPETPDYALTFIVAWAPNGSHLVAAKPIDHSPSLPNGPIYRSGRWSARRLLGITGRQAGRRDAER